MRRVSLFVLLFLAVIFLKGQYANKPNYILKQFKAMYPNIEKMDISKSNDSVYIVNYSTEEKNSAYTKFTKYGFFIKTVEEISKRKIPQLVFGGLHNGEFKNSKILNAKHITEPYRNYYQIIVKYKGDKIKLCYDTEGTFVQKQFLKGGYWETASGLKYKITHHGSGQKINSGDKIYAHYRGKLEDSTLFDESYKRNKPLPVTVGKGMVIKGWDEGLQLLREGDKATFIIPPDIAYGNKERPKIPANSTLIFDIEIVKVGKKWDLPQHDTIKLASGLQIIPLKTTDNISPEKGDKVIAHYSGYLTNGAMFDASYNRGMPFDFLIGYKQVIQGWEEGIDSMHIGDKWQLVVPAKLGYGSRANGMIPANSTLIFDIELQDVKKKIIPKPFDVAGKDTITTASGLKYIILEKGKGTIPKQNELLHVHYSGYFIDGKMFDSSVERFTPHRFKLGANSVIRGWEEAMTLLPKGTKARLVIPPNLAYGAKGLPPIIPENATVIFDIEILNK